MCVVIMVCAAAVSRLMAREALERRMVERLGERLECLFEHASHFRNMVDIIRMGNCEK